MNYLLKVDNLSVDYRTRSGLVSAVDDVSFTMGRGEVLGLVGESGSGKSTVGLSILRILPENAVVKGSIMFEGRNILEIDEEEMRATRGKSISIIFQDPSSHLNPLFTVGQHILDVMRAHLGKNSVELRKEAIKMLSMVGLPDPERVMGLYPHELSGGMQQRAMIAIALSTKPKLLIADEPTTAVDVTIQAQIIDLMLDLRRKLRLSVLFITHNLALISDIADRIAIMYAGNIVEIGRREDVLNSPLHPYTKGLLESIPKIESTRSGRLNYIPGFIPNLANPPPGCRFSTRCPYATEKCRFVKPQPYSEGGHTVYCHLYGE